MKVSRLLVAATLILATLCWAAANGGERRPKPSKAQPIKIVQSWSGKVADGALRKVEPAESVILDQQMWAKLWKAWRGQEKVPAVDFQKQMVLVFTADGPNNVGCTPTQDGKGNVRADANSTMIGGPGFGYLLLCISREGVQTVNGKPLPGVEVPPSKSRPKTPRGQPGFVPGSEPGSAPGSEPDVTVSPIQPPAEPVGAPDEETARRLATEWIKAQGYDWGEIAAVRNIQGRPAAKEDLWVVTFSKPVSRKVFGGVGAGTIRPFVLVYKKTGKVEMLSMN